MLSWIYYTNLSAACIVEWRYPTSSEWRAGKELHETCILGVCVCVPPGSFRGMGAFYFIKEIEETSITQYCWPVVKITSIGGWNGFETEKIMLLSKKTSTFHQNKKGSIILKIFCHSYVYVKAIYRNESNKKFI